MSWFSKKPAQPAASQQPAAPVSDFKAVYYTRDAVAPDPELDRLAGEEDASALQAAMKGLDERGRAQVIMRLGLPPVTSAKAATLSLYMTGEGILGEGASFALWQLLMSAATPDDLALLERVASPTPTHANYGAASAVVSRLMLDALGRELKVGELESVRNLIARHPRLIP